MNSDISQLAGDKDYAYNNRFQLNLKQTSISLNKESENNPCDYFVENESQLEGLEFESSPLTKTNKLKQLEEGKGIDTSKSNQMLQFENQESRFSGFTKSDISSEDKGLTPFSYSSIALRCQLSQQHDTNYNQSVDVQFFQQNTIKQEQNHKLEEEPQFKRSLSPVHQLEISRQLSYTKPCKCLSSIAISKEIKDFEYDEMEKRIFSYLNSEGVQLVTLEEYLHSNPSSPFSQMRRLSALRLDLTRSPLRRHRANTICL